MHLMWLSSLLWAEPVDEASDSEAGTEESSEEKAADKSAKDRKTSEDNADETEPTKAATETEESSDAEAGEPELPYTSRVQGVIHTDALAVMLPTIEVGGNMATVGTFTSGFMMNVGLGLRSWGGNYPDTVPMSEYTKNTELEFEFVGGFHLAYEVGRDRINESYALSKGGYFGFYELDDAHDKEEIDRFFAEGKNGVLLGLSKRTSLDDEQQPLPEIPQQWQLSATLSQEFEFLMLYQFTCVGFGSEDKNLPWRITYGMGVGAFF